MSPPVKDVSYRRRRWLWLTFTLISGAALLAGLYSWIQKLSSGLGSSLTLEEYDYQVFIMRLALCLGVAITASSLAILLLKWARDTRRQKEWPPKGLQLAADAPIRYGKAAEQVAQRLTLAAWMLVVFALVVLAWAGWRLGPEIF
ncbi:hypothetical protein [Arenimonas oryziterrae]|uniref:Uncharacterized protein n=1 Tax=Arenimonas oryziterrae DSM 21050 = YC6267 TaxID=1121015 RepID=A0A091AW03_9GAMM|nr:hypothetical protein [Arenimonas oryziterrae]KFN44443.1 hypothetical protein N789_00110 [Arenimonas oryziterrae DSM 21050 = YC6267]